MVEEKYPKPAEEIGPEKEFPKREYPEIEEIKERLEKLEAYLEKEKVPEEKERLVKEEIKSYLRELQETPAFAPPPAVRDEVKDDEVKITDMSKLKERLRVK